MLQCHLQTRKPCRALLLHLSLSLPRSLPWEHTNTLTKCWRRHFCASCFHSELLKSVLSQVLPIAAVINERIFLMQFSWQRIIKWHITLQPTRHRGWGEGGRGGERLDTSAPSETLMITAAVRRQTSILRLCLCLHECQQPHFLGDGGAPL